MVFDAYNHEWNEIEYFELGGFLEFLEVNDPDYHKVLFRDIVTRNIALRGHLTNENKLMRLAISGVLYKI